jgi:GTPase SAR1 family protein
MADTQIKNMPNLSLGPTSNLTAAESQIKGEPESSQEPTSNPFANPSFSFSEVPSIMRLEPLWKLRNERTRVQQVRINEEAAEHARKYFEGVEKVLNEHCTEVTSYDRRLNEISKFHYTNTFLGSISLGTLLTQRAAAILKRKRECEVRIGFLGGTGTGKSSLINALLQMKILPRNEEIASTAVPVEVSYNNDDDPEHRFKAEIEGISKAEFTKEVEDLFKNKENCDMNPEGEDDEVDVEAYQQILTTIEKIKWVYPYLQNIDDIDDTSAEDLLNEPHVQKMLDSKKHLTTATESTFADQIKQYIESCKPKDGEKATVSLWPLVKVVRIYVKADILKPGIILVDLPGSHDTSAARVAVTDNYRKNLTVSVVCAPAVRAGSDRVAQELLSSVERRKMQLNGLYTSDSLFFVITKIDDLMDYEAYIKDHENLQEANEKDMHRIQDKSQKISELQWELSKREPKQFKNGEALDKMEKSHEKLAAQVGKILEALSPSGQKRKRLDDITGKDIQRSREILISILTEIT